MIFRALNTIGLVAAVVLAFALYRAKTDAHEAREQMDALARMIQEERRAAGVLRAEIAFLERPERLRLLAERYLGLEPTASDQETTMEATMLALGMPPAGAPVTRFAAIDPAPSVAPTASAPVAAPAPAPVAPVRQAEIRPASAPVLRVAEAAPAQAPVPAPAAAPAPTRIAQVVEAEQASSDDADPIAGLIMAAGGMR